MRIVAPRWTSKSTASIRSSSAAARNAAPPLTAGRDRRIARCGRAVPVHHPRGGAGPGRRGAGRSLTGQPERESLTIRARAARPTRCAASAGTCRPGVTRVQPVARVGDLARVRRERGRVARDVDDPLRLCLEQAAHDLRRQSGAGRVDHDDVRTARRARRADAARCARRRRRSGRCRDRRGVRPRSRRRPPPRRARRPRPRRRAWPCASAIVPIPEKRS